jgi:hypothetical protein
MSSSLLNCLVYTASILIRNLWALQLEKQQRCPNIKLCSPQNTPTAQDTATLITELNWDTTPPWYQPLISGLYKTAVLSSSVYVVTDTTPPWYQPLISGLYKKAVLSSSVYVVSFRNTEFEMTLK